MCAYSISLCPLSHPCCFLYVVSHLPASSSFLSLFAQYFFLSFPHFAILSLFIFFLRSGHLFHSASSHLCFDLIIDVFWMGYMDCIQRWAQVL